MRESKFSTPDMKIPLFINRRRFYRDSVKLYER